MSLHCTLFNVQETNHPWYPEHSELEPRLSDLLLGCQDGDKDFLLNGLLAFECDAKDIGDSVFRPKDISVCRQWVLENSKSWCQSNWLKVLDLMEEDHNVYLSISW